MLFNETIREEKSTTIPRVSKDVHFSPITDKEDYHITFVKVENKGKSGNATLISGGLLENFVKLHFEAEGAKGFEFHILIYGYKIKCSQNSTNSSSFE